MKTKMRFFITLILLTSLNQFSDGQDNTQIGLPEGAIARLGKGGINIMRFSPDGKRLAVGTDIGVWIYNVEEGTGTPLYTDIPGQVNALAYTDDGKVLASGGTGNPSIQLWDLESNTKLTDFSLGGEYKYAVALVFKGKILLCYEKGGKISYWNIDSGFISSELTRFRGNDSVVFSPSGNILTGTDSIGKIHIYETSTKEHYSILQDVEERKDLLCVAFSPDEKIIANAGKQKTIRLLDYNENKVISSLEGHSADITCVAYSNDGKLLASGDANKEIIVWDTVKQKERIRLKGHRNTINALAFAPEGTPLYGMCLASGSADGTIRFWHPSIDKELVTFASGHNEWVKTIAFDKNGSILVSANFNGSVDYWSLKSYREISTLYESECDYASDVTFSPDATLFTCHGFKGYKVIFNHGRFGYSIQILDNFAHKAVQLWSLPTGKELIGPWNNTTSHELVLSQNTQKLAVYESNNIRGWHVETGVELFNIDIGDTRFIEDMKFSPDGKWLALDESSEKLKVWNVATPDNPPYISKYQAKAFAFSPNSQIIAILSQGNIYLEDINSPADDEPKSITTNLYGLFSKGLVFSPDNTIVVASRESIMSMSSKIKVFDVESGEEIVSLSGHTEPIESLVFSHDGKVLASCSHDGTILLWDWDKISKK